MTPTKPTFSPRGYYSVSDAARHLEVHRNSVHNYIRAGFLHLRESKLTSRKVLLGKDLIDFWESMNAIKH